MILEVLLYKSITSIKYSIKPTNYNQKHNNHLFKLIIAISSYLITFILSTLLFTIEKAIIKYIFKFKYQYILTMMPL